MCGKRCCLTLILLLFCVAVAHSQERSAGNAYTRTDGDFISADTLENCIRIHKQCRDIEIHFKWDKYNLELDYMGNRASLERFDHKLDSIGLAQRIRMLMARMPMTTTASMISLCPTTR